MNELLQRFRMGLCTPEEVAVIHQWYDAAAAAGEWSWTETERNAFREEVWMDVRRGMESAMPENGMPDSGVGHVGLVGDGAAEWGPGGVSTEPEDDAGGAKLRGIGWRRWTAVAAVLLGLVAGAYWIWGGSGHPGAVPAGTANAFPKDVLPGGNKAILTLADGSTVVLDTTKNGVIGLEGNSRIVKQEDGKVVYAAVPEGKDGAGGGKDGVKRAVAGTIDGQGGTAGGGPGSVASTQTVTYNKLSTPKGGQYQLELPDGSKVWLNAASSIRYPTAFTGKERRVEVSGEVYFEVAAWKGEGRGHGHLPFIVSVTGPGGIQGGEVEVLGTHFNIDAYADDNMIRTTLLNGAVRLVNQGGGLVLKPGQQAGYGKAGKPELVKDADVEEAVAWKNGVFLFDEAGIETVMRQVERWYDVEVIYSGKIPSGHFSGTVDRKANISQVLKILELSGVQFRIEGRRIVILPG